MKAQLERVFEAMSELELRDKEDKYHDFQATMICQIRLEGYLLLKDIYNFMVKYNGKAKRKEEL